MKHVKTLGLCLVAALSLMAFTAAAAQAEWLVEKVPTEDATGEAVIHPLKGGLIHGVLLVPAKSLEILCSKLKTTEGLVYAPTLILGKLEFTECKTFQSGKESVGCKPIEPITAKVRAHLILHPTTEAKLTYVLLEPDLKNSKNEELAPDGSKFTTIEFKEETCALVNSEVKGETVAECLNETLETMPEVELKEAMKEIPVGNPDLCLVELEHHLIQEIPFEKRSLLGITEAKQLKYGANPALIDGILDAFLTGVNLHKKWSGHV